MLVFLYFKQLKNHYSLSDIILFTIIFVGIIELIDFYNLPSILLNNTGYLITSICLTLLFIVKMFQIGIFSTIRLSMINIVDKLIACGLISLATIIVLQYFISSDLYLYMPSFEISLDNDAFNKKSKEYYDLLFDDKNNKKYISLLSELFPYVKRYQENLPIKEQYPPDNKYTDIVKGKRIKSAKYFELYFTKSHNVYSRIAKLFDVVIPELNEEPENIKLFVQSLYIDYDPWNLKIVFDTLYHYLSGFGDRAKLDLAYELVKNYDGSKNVSEFFALTTLDRVASIVAEILAVSSEDDFNTFLKTEKRNYRQILLLSYIKNWIGSEKLNKNDSRETRKEEMTTMLSSMGREVCEQRIDIYSEKVYNQKCTFALYWATEGTNLNIKEYIGSILNEDSVIRFIYDMCSMSVGSEIRYTLKQSTIETFTTESAIDKIIDKKKSVNEDEKFVMEIYRAYKNKHNKEDEDGLMCKEQRFLKI